MAAAKLKPSSSIDRLIEPLVKCLTVESAKRLLSMKTDPQLRARMEELAEKSTAGTLTAEERQEYGSYVSFGTFIAILKSKARLLLDNDQSTR
jgi:hypothetical protein